MTDNKLAEIVDDTEKHLVEEIKLKIKGEDNFICPMDDWYLLRFIRYKKHDLDKAFAALLSWWKDRHQLPELHDGLYPSVYEEHYQTKFSTTAANRDKQGRQIVLWKIGNWDPSKINFLEIFKSNFPIVDTISTRQQTQLHGCVFILDLEGLGLRHVSACTPNHLRILLSLTDGFPLNIKGIHFVNHPRIFQVVWACAKILMKAKMKKRVQFHSGDFSSLHEHFEPSILPVSYGGTLSDEEFEEENFVTILHDRESYFRELFDNMGYTVKEKNK